MNCPYCRNPIREKTKSIRLSRVCAACYKRVRLNLATGDYEPVPAKEPRKVPTWTWR